MAVSYLERDQFRLKLIALQDFDETDDSRFGLIGSEAIMV